MIVDKLTYAGSLHTLETALGHPRVVFVQADIADRAAMARTFADHRPGAVLNLAAETHVDRSIDGPAPFIASNVVGTFVLLESSLALVASLPSAERERFRFVQVSTDEVYGSLGTGGSFTEASPYAPNSPYAASKASADYLARAYFQTYGLPTIITNSSNNYGPYQFPEKLIPLMTLNAIDGRPLPVYGDGANTRDWLHVEDHCAGLLAALERGRPGEKYNIGGGNERTNLQIVSAVCDALEAVRPAAGNPLLAGCGSYRSLVTFVPDRPGHDRRYAIDASKSRRELGWEPRHDFDSGLRATVAWYLEHRDWCTHVQKGLYDRERLGLSR